jgi:copper resistance protein D
MQPLVYHASSPKRPSVSLRETSCRVRWLVIGGLVGTVVFGPLTVQGAVPTVTHLRASTLREMEGAHVATTLRRELAATRIAPTDEPGATFDADAPTYVAIRWFTYVAVLCLVGAVVVHFAVLGRLGGAADAVMDELRTSIDTRTAGVGAFASGMLIVVAVARLTAQSLALFGAEWHVSDVVALVTGTTWGTGWLLLTGAGPLGVIGFRRAGSRSPSGWTWSAAAGAMAALSLALSGHAVAASGWRFLTVPADTLHVVGAGAWLGSLAVLVAAGLPVARRLSSGPRDLIVASLLRAFSPVALVGATVVGVTGALAAWVHLGGVTLTWSNAYVRVALYKLAVVSLVALLGAYNWRRILPTLGASAATRRLHWSASTELVLALVVLVITAVLVATSPLVPVGS